MGASNLKNEQARILYAGLPNALLANATLASFLAAIQSAVIDPIRLFAWFGLLATALLVRLMLLLAWRRTGLKADQSIPRWINWYRATVIALGISWGAGTILLFPTGNILHQAFLAFVMAGLCSGAVSLLAVDRVSTLGYLIPALSPLVVSFLMEEGRISKVMGIMVALFLFFVAANSLNVWRILTENVRLRTKSESHEEALIHSEERLKEAQRVAGMGSYDWNPAANELKWSDGHFRLWGLDPQSVKPSYELFRRGIHPDDVVRVEEALQHALHEGHIYECFHRVVWPDGKVLHIYGRGEITFNQAGQSIRMIGTVQDITERMQAEVERQAALDKLQKISNRVPGLVYQFKLRPDGSACFPYASEARHILFRARPDEVHESADKVFAAIHPEDLQGFIATIHKSAHNMMPWHHEFRTKFIDGTERWLYGDASPQRERDGSTLWHGFISDISERKNAEAEINHLSRTYRLLSQVNEAIVRSSDQSELFTTICNAATESGLFRFAWIGMVEEDWVIPVAYAGIEEGYLAKLHIQLNDEYTGNGPTAMAIRKGNPVISQNIANDQIMAPWRDEALKRGYHAAGAFPIREASKVIGTINVYAVDAYFFTPRIARLVEELSSDISFALDVFTERKNRQSAEDRIMQLNADLEHRVLERTHQLEIVNRELEAFCYSVSHDLRSPLRSINGFSQILLTKYHDQLDGKGKDYLRRVHQASRHMGHLIDDLLLLSQVTRGTLTREQVDLSKIAQEVTSRLRKSNPKRKVKFSLQQGLSAHADPGLMNIVMNNLMDNAYKYSGRNASAEIEFGEQLIDGERTFFVRDNGAGFNMDFAHKLFGAFQRLHSEDEFEGIGIGLATIQRIIHRHHGKVWAESKEGQGATFYFTLPQRERES